MARDRVAHKDGIGGWGERGSGVTGGWPGKDENGGEGTRRYFAVEKSVERWRNEHAYQTPKIRVAPRLRRRNWRGICDPTVKFNTWTCDSEKTESVLRGRENISCVIWIIGPSKGVSQRRGASPVSNGPIRDKRHPVEIRHAPASHGYSAVMVDISETKWKVPTRRPQPPAPQQNCFRILTKLKCKWRCCRSVQRHRRSQEADWRQSCRGREACLVKYHITRLPS